MLRRGLAVLVLVGAMGAWAASPAAAQENPSVTGLSVMVCVAPDPCQVVPIIDQPHNSSLDMVLSTGDSLVMTAFRQCALAGQQEIPLGNGGKLVVCPGRVQYERREDLVRYVAPDGQMYSVGSYYWYGMCERRHRIGLFTGDGFNDQPVVGISHNEYPCTV